MTDRIVLMPGDCLARMEQLKAAGVFVDSCVTDPPYHLTSIVKRFGGANAAPAKEGTDGLFARASRGFMGQRWDGGDIAFRPETWRAVFDLLKPGGHLLAFSSTRTYHRMAVAIDDAGFEVREMCAWVYGTGFPKSLDVGKAIDKSLGAERKETGPNPLAGKQTPKRDTAAYGDFRGVGPLTAPATPEAAQWDGWGTALKPALEPLCLARKPLEGTVAENVLKWGTGGLNIDGCRIAPTGENRSRAGEPSEARRYTEQGATNFAATPGPRGGDPQGRWPANLQHDGSDEVTSCFPDPAAARFFYSPKATKAERAGSKHPTVKPVDLLRYYVRLITPPGGVVLDPFAGTGTTGEAAHLEGMRAILIEREAEYVEDIKRRLAALEDV